jgi:pantoate--beta-alanine ligase
MIVLSSPTQMRSYSLGARRPLGLVPTMGALHAGHLALVDAARAHCTSVIVSIFVNPLQFGPGEDFARYPRAFEADVAMLEERGVQAVYAPSAEAMYRPGFGTSIDVGPVARPLEGALRPTHFAGVATVVTKLLHAIPCDVVYFGAKDAQQTVVIRRLLEDLDLPTRLEIVPIVRDADGLALSSRNAYLAPDERAAAPSLYRALQAAMAALRQGERDLDVIRKAARAEYVAPLREAYLELVDPATFEPLTEVRAPAILVGSAQVGAVRILDALGVPGADGIDPLTRRSVAATV